MKKKKNRSKKSCASVPLTRAQSNFEICGAPLDQI
jgi:hypothetical protein